jgi:hemerythrin-like domain-containing protein
MNVIDLLTNDHDKVSELFEEFESHRQIEIANRIFKELEIHATLEEEIVYPAMQQLDEDMITESLVDHDMVRDMIEELRGIEISDEKYLDKFEELRASVEDHVAVEETELFPVMEQKLSNELDNMGMRCQKRKEELMRGKAMGASAS